MFRALLGLWFAVALCPDTLRAQFGAPAPADAPPQATKSETRRWEFGIIVTAVGGPCGGLSGTFPVPRDWPEQQVKVASEDFSPSVRAHAYRDVDGLKQ